MPQYEVRHRCDPKTCARCKYFYWNSKLGVYACRKGKDELVGRYAVGCDDYKERPVNI